VIDTEAHLRHTLIGGSGPINNGAKMKLKVPQSMGRRRLANIRGQLRRDIARRVKASVLDFVTGIR
jgi:hypothetical protein